MTTTAQTSLRLTRAQVVAAVGKDPATVRTFERLVAGAVPVRTLTASGAINAADRLVLVSGFSTVTLPLASDVVGQTFTIKRVGVNTVIVQPQTGETIDGASSSTLAIQYQSVTVVSTGASWVIV
jgi:hypothetical protein